MLEGCGLVLRLIVVCWYVVSVLCIGVGCSCSVLVLSVGCYVLMLCSGVVCLVPCCRVAT